MIDWRFAAIAVALTGSLTAAGLPFVESLPGGAAGLITGALFSLVSFVVAHHWVRRGAARGGGAFPTAVFGGFLARMIALLVLGAALAFTTAAHAPTALLTIVAGHFVMMPVELVYLRRTGALR